MNKNQQTVGTVHTSILKNKKKRGVKYDISK